jgi:hypothetical protein
MWLLNLRAKRAALPRLTADQRAVAGDEASALASDLGLTFPLAKGASRRERRRAAKTALEEARNSFRMKPIHLLSRPAFSRQRWVGLIVLRSYLLIAFSLTVAKIVGA